ncbi:MAG: hypothetical protein ACOZCO_10860 [Bacteroidota bacterium]
MKAFLLACVLNPVVSFAQHSPAVYMQLCEMNKEWKSKEIFSPVLLQEKKIMR